MRARCLKCLAIAGAVFAGFCFAAWSFLARDSRWFIERPGGVETRLHVGDVYRISGPRMHFPDGDMYLLYWDLHRVPWLFHWSVVELGPVPTNAATVDAFGWVHANRPGVIDVRAVPRFGRGFAWARFFITPVGQDPPDPVRVVNSDVCSQRLDPTVFRCKLGPPLGVVDINLRADRAQRRLTTLIVSSSTDSVIQSIELPRGVDVPPPSASEALRAFDVDADGHPDLVLLTGMDAEPDGDPQYRVWRFDPSRTRFVSDTAFGLRRALSPVPGQPCVMASIRTSLGHDLRLVCLDSGRWVERP